MAAYKWTVLGSTTIGGLMSSIDSTIVLISLPTILKQLPGTDANEGLWIVMSYTLVTAILLLNFGRIGDMFGRVKTYNLGFAIFTVGSLLCGLSETGLQLIVFRIFQGIGAAFLWANTAAILTDSFPVNERGRAIGVNQISVVSGSVIGLALGGILTGLFGWRSIFFVNVPIGIFATVWSHYKLKETDSIRRGEKLDIWGNLTFAVGLTLVLLGVTLGSLSEWSIFNISLIGVGALLLVAYCYIESKVKQPMFQLSLFRNRVFAAGNVAILLFGLARGALAYLMVFYLQGILGDDAFTAGLLLIPLSISITFIGPISGWLSDKFGARWFVSAGLIVTGVGFIILAQLSAQVSYSILVVPLLLLGAGMGLFSAPNRSETLSSVPPERRGVASGINATLMNTGMLLSLGMSIAIVAFFVPDSVVVAVFGGAVLPPNSGTTVISFMEGLHFAYYVSAFLSLASIIPVVAWYRNSSKLRYDVQHVAEESPGSLTSLD